MRPLLNEFTSVLDVGAADRNLNVLNRNRRDSQAIQERAGSTTGTNDATNMLTRVLQLR